MEIFDIAKMLLLSVGIFIFGYIFHRPKIMKFASMAVMIALGIAAMAGFYGQFILMPAFYMAGYVAADIFDKEGKINEMSAVPKRQKRKSRYRR